MAETWLKCSACRSDLAFGSKYFQCSVSTCNRARMRLVFCSVPCWDSHVATLRHRDAWAEDKIAPSKAAWERELADQPAELVGRGMSPAGPPAPAVPRQAATAPVVRHTAPATPDRPPPAPPASAAPLRRIVGEPAPVPSPAGAAVALQDVGDRDMMIVVSKLKKYIKDRSGMNCSDAVADVLSDHVRALCDESIRAAGRDERKTVLDRDVPRPPRR
ncbi:MAG TPA: hypothetical protein VK601_28135 [Kofleriaceae bacterium]|nr:hypothetical protein [Kofleriaceae bacterium]